MSTETVRDDIRKRLKRADGHLKSILLMLDDEQRSCLEIAQQLKAVEKAIINAKQVFVHSYIEYCLTHAEEDREAVLGDFKEITKYL